MAISLNAGDYGRADLFNIAPEDITVNQSENGRLEPHSPEEIESLARSILENGQLQPVIVRRIDDRRVQLVAGYGRHRAVKYINEALQPSSPVKLQCKVMDGNAEEAFVRNLVENLQRADTTSVDDAHNQRRLREQYGWSETKIAEFYKKSVAYISQLRKTLSLSSEIQARVASGDMAVSAAIDLADVPEADRAAIVAEATASNGKVSTETIRKRVRDKALENGKDKHKGRSIKEVCAFLEDTSGPGEKESVAALCEMLVAFIRGRKTEKQMHNALEKYSV